MGLLKNMADNTNVDSVATRARRRRFDFFLSLLQDVPRPCVILDIGGTENFWVTMGMADRDDIRIVLLNLDQPQSTRPNISMQVGDARDMRQFHDGQFEVVFSNSVIEHVGGFADQQRMAKEICRVGKRYFIQTPNLYFPIEPHFLFPMYQFLPRFLRVQLLRRFKLGWMGRVPDKTLARQKVDSVRLLSRRQMTKLFPDASIYHEKLGGLTKSFIAYGGWKPTD